MRFLAIIDVGYIRYRLFNFMNTKKAPHECGASHYSAAIK
jgi:hypothetical protein